MEGWKYFEGKNVKLIFDDSRSGSIKIGKVKSANKNYICISTAFGEESIIVSRIIRIELLKDGGKNENSNEK